MANFFQSVRQGFGGGRNRNANALPSPGLNPSYGPSTQETVHTEILVPETPKYFFQEKYAKLGVRGNFMPLAAKPKNVDLGDWLAHQAVEQYKMLDLLVSCIQEIDTKTGYPLCNPKTCPVMSAGSHTYTWLNANKEPVKVPAVQYIGLVQRWIIGKLSDERVFPTARLSPGANSNPVPGERNWVGKATNFPENFYTDCKTIFRQIFRVYAHIYHSHWVDPFWHIHNSNPQSSGWTDLNSCFVHYITVAKLFGLLTDKDMEPMQPLIDIWISNGSIPADAANSTHAIPYNQ